MPRFNKPAPNNIAGNSPYPEGWEDLLLRYALGDLSSEEEATFQQLLIDYPELQPEAKASQTSLESLPLPLSERSPSDPSNHQVIHQARTIPALPVEGSVRPSLNAAQKPAGNAARPISRQRPAQNRQKRSEAPVRRRAKKSNQRRQRSRTRSQEWAVLGVMGFAVMLGIAAIAGISNYQLRSQLGQTAQKKEQYQELLDARTRELSDLNLTQKRDRAILMALRQPNAAVYEMQGGEGTFRNVFGRLIVVPNNQEVTLVSKQLPALTDAEVYRLWALTSNTAEPLYCGDFNFNPEETIVWTLPNERCSQLPAKMVVTAEAINEKPVPQGPDVLSGTLR
ncbi:MAG: anti-sigma factor [Cyanobacteria bacterium P01_F01_bin.53]